MHRGLSDTAGGLAAPSPHAAEQSALRQHASVRVLHVGYRGVGLAAVPKSSVRLVMLSRERGVVVSRSTTAQGRYGTFSPKSSSWFAGLEYAATMDGPALLKHVEAMYPQVLDQPA